MSVEDLVKDKHALELLQAMLDGTINDVKEVRHVETRLSYLPVEHELAVPAEKLGELLERLTLAGILRKVTYDNVLSCSKCNSVEISSEFFCPKCEGVDLDKEMIIEHYKCGFTGGENLFRKGQDYVCPKCSKVLSQIGVDYIRLGVAYECMQCHEKFTEPVEKWTCQDCGNRFETKEASLRYLHVFKLADDAKITLRQLLFDAGKVVDYLKLSGFEVEAPTRLRGQSGLVHKFDIRVLEPKGRSKTPTLIRILRSPSEASYQEILSFYAEACDLKPNRLIAVAIPRLQSEAKQFAATYGISVIEAEKPEDVIAKLQDKTWMRTPARYRGPRGASV